MNLSELPLIGWIVILITVVLIFILIWFKGLHIVGEKGGIKTIDQKLDQKLHTYEDKRAKDENKRIDLYGEIKQIDEIEQKRIEEYVETAKKQIKNVFRDLIVCGVALNHITDKMISALLQKVDEDDFRRKLDPNNIEVYKKDIEVAVSYEYDEIRRYIEKSHCVDQLNSFEEVRKKIKEILDGWCDNVRGCVITSCSDKIKVYEFYQDSFSLESYKDNFVMSPLVKNRGYLERLTIKPKNDRKDRFTPNVT